MTGLQKKPEDQVLAAHKGQPVILFPTIHLAEDVIMDVAIATAKATNKPLGLEMFRSADGVMVEALRTGEISRSDFITIYTIDAYTEPPPMGTPAYYLGRDRAIRKMEKLADAILDGVEIVPLGTKLGLTAATDDRMQAAMVDWIDFREARLQHDTNMFMKRDDELIKADPKKYFEGYQSWVMEKLDSLELPQMGAVVEVMGRDFVEPEDYIEAIGDLYYTMHPAWLSKYETEQKLAAYQKQQKAYAENLDFNPTEIIGPIGRLRNDSFTAFQIERQIKEDPRGMVVVFGGAHTIHNNTMGGDIDSNLRRRNIPVMIIDSEIKGEMPCTSTVLCKEPGERAKHMALSQTFLQAALDDGDPDRIRIQLDPPPPPENRIPVWIPQGLNTMQPEAGVIVIELPAGSQALPMKP